MPPPRQKVPRGHTACEVRRAGSGPSEKFPGPTGRGAPDPSGQNTVSLPQVQRMLESEPRGQ